MMPRRRKASKLGVKTSSVIRCASHLKWIRGHECAACGAIGGACHSRIEAAHVRTGTDGGMSLKPGDNWTIPLCAHHHEEQHRIGEPDFERVYKIDMKAIAQKLWAMSPHRKKFEQAA